MVSITAPPRRFRPSLWATVFTVPAVLVMLVLGTWQVQRLEWKTGMIQRVQERATAAPVPLPAEVADPDSFDFRPVAVTGRFLHDREMLALARPRQGQVGYEVVTPLERADGGPAVLVNRGWVPMDKRDPAARREGRVEGAVTLRGVARLPAEPGWMQPDNRPGVDTWMRVDPRAMAAAAGLAAVSPLVVEAAPGQVPGGLPAGIETRAELPNNHLQYAFTWYALAATLLVVYVVFHLRRTEGPHDRLS